MTPRTGTLPLTDSGMWRKLLARAHPDAGGDEGLFIWALDVRDTVRGDSLPAHAPTTAPEPTYQPCERIPYDGSLEFFELTSRALSVGQSVEEPYRSVLRLLIDCIEVDHGRGYRGQYVGATYRQLAYIGHLLGMGKEARARWYEIAEEIPLAARHATHVIQKLKEGRC